MSQLTFEDGEGRALTLKRSGTKATRGHGAAQWPLRIRYRLYGNSLEDRTRDIDDTHAFPQPCGGLSLRRSPTRRPRVVQLAMPEGWAMISPASRPLWPRVRPGTQPTIAWSIVPWKPAPLKHTEFAAGPVKTTVAIHGPWDGNAERIKTDVAALMNAAADVFGSAPMPTETLPIPPRQRRGAGGYGGYYNSTVVHTDPKAFWDKERYEGMLSLFAHEYFHTWNVKRFRPAPIAALRL